MRSRPTTYWHRWNSSSSRYSCSAVNEVRVRLGRSRSRPFGSTISRMVPLASVRKSQNFTKKIKQNLRLKHKLQTLETLWLTRGWTRTLAHARAARCEMWNVTDMHYSWRQLWANGLVEETIDAFLWIKLLFAIKIVYVSPQITRCSINKYFGFDS